MSAFGIPLGFAVDVQDVLLGIDDLDGLARAHAEHTGASARESTTYSPASCSPLEVGRFIQPRCAAHAKSGPTTIPTT